MPTARRIPLSVVLALSTFASACARPTPAVEPTPGFSLRVAPDAPQVDGQGAAVPLVVQVTPENGFTGKVSFTLRDGQGAPLQGLALDPASVTVSGADARLVPMTLTQSADLPTGVLAASLVASGPGASASVPLAVDVVPPTAPPLGLALTVAPGAATLDGAGSQTSLVVQITPEAGFHGTVTLGLTDPTGAALTGLALSPATVDVAGPGPQLVQVTLSQTADLPVAPVAAQLQAQGTGASAAAPLSVDVIAPPVTGASPDFIFSPPPIIQAQLGEPLQVVYTLTPVDGFTGTVTVKAHSANNNIFGDGIDVPLAGGPVAILASFNVGWTAGSTDQLTFTATSGTLSHTATSKVLVGGAQSVETSVSPSAVTIAPGSSAIVVVSTRGSNGYDTAVTPTWSSPAPTGITFSPPFVPVVSDQLTVTAVRISVAADAPPESTSVLTFGPGTQGIDAVVSVVVPSPPTPSVTASISPQDIAVRPGDTATVNMELVSQNGYDNPVSLGGGATGVTLADTLPPLWLHPDAPLLQPVALAFDTRLAQGTTTATLIVYPGSLGYGIPIAQTTLTVHRLPSFVTHTTNLGTPAVDAALGDLDGTGGPDVVVAEPAAHAVMILLDQPGGQLGAPAPLPTPGSPVGVALADVNADGHLDLVVAETGPDAVLVYPGVGDGTFGAPTTVTPAGTPADVAVGDLDGDGHLDLAIAESAPAQLEVVFGNGDGSFVSTTTTRAVPSGARQSIVVALDAQGRPLAGVVDYDAASASWDLLWDGLDQRRHLLGGSHFTGAGIPGRFFARTLPSNGFTGLWRLIPVTDQSHLANVVPQNYTAWIAMGQGPTEVTAGDLDGDGITDLVSANGDGSIEMRLGNGHAAWLPPQGDTGTAAPVALLAGDLDGDGYGDLVLVDASGAVHVMLSR